jgi:hypothetical protein
MTKYTEYKRNGKSRYQVVVPVMAKDLIAHDGTKIKRTMSITVYCVLAGDTLVHAGLGSFGRVVNGKVEESLPKLIQYAHDQYKEYKKPAEQKALEAIIHNEPVLRESAA